MSGRGFRSVLIDNLFRFALVVVVVVGDEWTVTRRDLRQLILYNGRAITDVLDTPEYCIDNGWIIKPDVDGEFLSRSRHSTREKWPTN